MSFLGDTTLQSRALQLLTTHQDTAPKNTTRRQLRGASAKTTQDVCISHPL
jgi:hypothetical protein